MKDLNSHCRLAIVQAAPVMFDKDPCLEKAIRLIEEAAQNGAELIVFPELFLPGYPYGMTFGYTVGSRKEPGRADWKIYYDNSILSDGAEMQQLIDCLNEMERLHAQKNLRAYTDMDSKLHGLLIELCGNSLLESMYARIHSLNQQFRIYSLTSTQRFNESMEEHRDIVHCLLTNNADEARAINKRHLQLAKDKIIQHFSEQEALKQAADAQPKTTAEADKKAK